MPLVDSEENDYNQTLKELLMDQSLDYSVYDNFDPLAGCSYHNIIKTWKGHPWGYQFFKFCIQNWWCPAARFQARNISAMDTIRTHLEGLEIVVYDEEIMPNIQRFVANYKKAFGKGIKVRRE